jgi:CRP-like cAMP-binding protein
MTLASMIETLRSHPFTEGMTESQLKVLSELAELVHFEADRRIFGAGERPRFFYLLLSGTVFLELQTPVYTVCIQQLNQGETFGWSALVDQPFRAFQVRSRDACSVVRLPGDRLLKACEEDERLGLLVFRYLAAMIARRLRAAEARFAEFCGKGNSAKIPA